MLTLILTLNPNPDLNPNRNYNPVCNCAQINITQQECDYCSYYYIIMWSQCFMTLRLLEITGSYWILYWHKHQPLEKNMHSNALSQCYHIISQCTSAPVNCLMKLCWWVISFQWRHWQLLSIT